MLNVLVPNERPDDRHDRESGQRQTRPQSQLLPSPSEILSTTEARQGPHPHDYRRNDQESQEKPRKRQNRVALDLWLILSTTVTVQLIIDLVEPDDAVDPESKYAENTYSPRIPDLHARPTDFGFVRVSAVHLPSISSPAIIDTDLQLAVIARRGAGHGSWGREHWAVERTFGRRATQAAANMRQP